MILSICDNAETLLVIKMIKTIITIIRIAVPILLIVSISLDYVKSIQNADIEKSNKKLVNKSIAALIVLFVPSLVSIILNLVWSDADFTKCLNNATSDGILQSRVNYTEKLITILENEFSYANYTYAIESVKDIDDETKREQLLNKVKSYEKYIDLANEINDLSNNFDRTKFTQLSEEVEKIENESIKARFQELLEQAGGKLLNVDAGTYSGKLADLSYKVFIPKGATTNMPLIMYLHGDGGGEERLSYYAKKTFGGSFPFIVVAPIGGMWAETSGRTANLKKIIDKVCEEYSCDTQRISISGHSRGAIGVWAMVNQYPKLFYSAVPVSCGGNINASNFRYTKLKAYCGNQGDDINYYYNRMKSNVDAINKAGGNAKFYELNAGHSGTPALTYKKELFEWMIE